MSLNLPKYVFLSSTPTGVGFFLVFFSLSSFLLAPPTSIPTIYNYSIFIMNKVKTVRYTFFCRYIGDTENIQQQLSRSFSLDIPMELKRNQYSMPPFTDLSPRVRYSTNHHSNRASVSLEKPNRLSLNLGSKNHSQVSLENRQV